MAEGRVREALRFAAAAACRGLPPPHASYPAAAPALSAGGLERVRRSKALRCLVPIFSSKQYVKALQGEWRRQRRQYA